MRARKRRKKRKIERIVISSAMDSAICLIFYADKHFMYRWHKGKSGKNPLRMGVGRDFITDIGSDLQPDLDSDLDSELFSFFFLRIKGRCWLCG